MLNDLVSSLVTMLNIESCILFSREVMLSDQLLNTTKMETVILGRLKFMCNKKFLSNHCIYKHNLTSFDDQKEKEQRSMNISITVFSTLIDHI